MAKTPEIDIVGLPEENKIRTVFFSFEGIGPHQFDASVLKPYSYALVNTGAADIMKGKMILVKGSNQADQNILPFPAVGTYKRNEILEFTIPGAGTKTCYIRAEMELVY